MNYNKIYFIGIGGIGMSALARFCKTKGCAVAGYDKTASPLTLNLEKEGIDIHYEDDCSRIPKDIERTLIVYTPAIPEDMGELRFAREHGYRVIKRAQMLGELTIGSNCLAVAGTHGKTTTSTLVAHILSDSQEECSAFLGGISNNYGTNMLVSNARAIVVEADEFDRSFLYLRPNIASINSMDADHLDIYGDIEHLHEAFRQFASYVKNSLIVKYGLPISSSDTKAKLYSYHLCESNADFYGKNIRLDESGHYCFDLVYPDGVLSDIKVGALGRINVENSIAAAAICLKYGIEPQKIRKAIGSFTGVQRRLDKRISHNGITYIDDYAHHPTELSCAIDSVREIFPGKKICGIFQPHLYTRTRDFAPEFARSLSALDKLILLDIYPAREKPIEGVSSEIIFKDVSCAEKVELHKEELLEYLAENMDFDVLMTLGAGDIDRFIVPITELIQSR